MEMIHVVIPCFNSELYVEETIASVKAQTWHNWDCVIVDDGSTDRSGAIIDAKTEGDKRFRVFHTQNKGVAAARNFGISHFRGGYVLPLDADDVLLPNALKCFARAWEEHPEASLLVPQIRRFSDEGDLGIQERKWRGYEHLKKVCTPTNSSCFRWSDWKRVGGYNGWSGYEDWEFWLRLLFHNDNVVNIPEVLVEYRVHPDSRYHQVSRHHDREVEFIRSMNPDIFGK